MCALQAAKVDEANADTSSPVELSSRWIRASEA